MKKTPNMEPHPDQLSLWPDDDRDEVPGPRPDRPTSVVHLGTELLSTVELAQRWGCSRGWLANLRSAGVGPAFIKLGSNVRYRMADVLAYEESSSSAG